MKRIFWIVWFLLSCSSHESKRNLDSEGLIVLRKYFDNGILENEVRINSDSVLNGTSRSYYKSGKIRVEAYFKDGKRNGVAKGYFDNGQLHYIGRYRDDQKDSSFYWYDENGHLKQLENWLDGEQIGEQKSYFLNGRMKYYEIIARVNERPFYKAELDSLGNLLHEDGNPLNMMVRADRVFRVGDTLLASFPLAIRDYSLVELTMKRRNQFGQIEKIPLRAFDTLYFGIGYNLQEPLNEIGRVDYEFVLSLTGSSSGQRKLAKLNYYLEVKAK